MDAVETRSHQEIARSVRSATLCPICSGAMIVLRDESRCCQCNFVICESCEGGHEPDD